MTVSVTRSAARGALLLWAAWSGLGLVGPRPASAGEGPAPPAEGGGAEPDGGKLVFDGNFGLGFGFTEAGAGGLPFVDLGLRLGGALIPQLELTGELSTTWVPASEYGWFRLRMVTSYCPLSVPGPYLLAGVGFSILWVGGPVIGLDLKGGVGHRIPLNERWSLMLELDWEGFLLPEGSYSFLLNVISVQVGFSWR